MPIFCPAAALNETPLTAGRLSALFNHAVRKYHPGQKLTNSYCKRISWNSTALWAVKVSRFSVDRVFSSEPSARSSSFGKDTISCILDNATEPFSTVDTFCQEVTVNVDPHYHNDIHHENTGKLAGYAGQARECKTHADVRIVSAGWGERIAMGSTRRD
jgi:hypothetical protein